MTKPQPDICPCGSDQAYSDCCGQYHSGKATAPTPEALMRSRFSAYSLNLSDYLLKTWANETRPENIDQPEAVKWTKLEILGHSITPPAQGEVHFKASYCFNHQWQCLEEHSTFIQESGAWVYLDGSTKTISLKPKRNEPCPCGSQKKFKHCCFMTLH